MKKMIIIDDEPLIANGLAKLIEKSDYALTIHGIFFSSTEAIHYCQNEKIDIILTDINMPKINGLELIRTLKEFQPNIQFIILTGFGSYDYAKEAMSLGIQHFLEKPVKKKELYTTLNQVIQKMEHSHVEQQLLIQRGIERVLSHKEWNYWPETLTFPIHLYTYDSTFYSAICSLLHPLIINDSIISGHTKQTGYFLFLDKMITTDTIQDYLKNSQEINPLILYSLNQNMSELVRNFHKFRKYFNQSFYLDCSTTVNLNELPETYTDTTYEVFIDKIMNVIDRCDFQFSLNLIDQFFDEYRKILYPVKKLRLQAIHFLNQIYQRFLAENESEFIDYTPKIMLVEHWTELKGLFTDAIHLLETSLEIKSENNIVQSVNLTIEKHYAEKQLSMKWLAQNILFLNPDYVGKVYQQETGLRFNTKLTAYRMEKAKDFLKQGYKVYEVASMTGYDNSPEYFIQIFKKYFGVTPKQYLRKSVIS